MTELLNYSEGILTGRRKSAGSSIVGTGNYLFALGPQDGPQFTYSSDIFTIDSVPYNDDMGWTVGDFHEVSQSVDLGRGGDGWIYFSGKCRNLDGTPPGTAWEFSISIAGTKMASRLLSNRELSLDDVRAPLPPAFGSFHTVAFRLELIAI